MSQDTLAANAPAMPDVSPETPRPAGAATAARQIRAALAALSNAVEALEETHEDDAEAIENGEDGGAEDEAPIFEPGPRMRSEPHPLEARHLDDGDDEEAEERIADDEAALHVWRDLISARAEERKARAAHEAALARIPENLLPGPKYIHAPDREPFGPDSRLAENSPWPCEPDPDLPQLGSRILRWTPEEIFEGYRQSFFAGADVAGRRVQALHSTARRLARLAELVEQQVEAFRAGNITALEEAARAKFYEVADLERKLLNLDASSPVRLALSTLERWRIEEGEGGLGDFVGNESIYYATLMLIVDHLPADLAEAVRAAMTFGPFVDEDEETANI